MYVPKWLKWLKLTENVRPHLSGLIYLRARYYDPSIGRFITVDPIKDGTNWYVYCSNNPVAFVDPSGLFGENTELRFDCNNGIDVTTLQKKLNELGYTGKNGEKIAEDGHFGEVTEYAVNCYKNDNNLPNTGKFKGVVDVVTWKHMGLTVDNTFEVGISHSGSVDSKALYLEASGPNTNGGLNLASGDAGLFSAEQNYEYLDLGFGIAGASTDIGISTNYIGAQIGASLVNGSVTFKIPLPFTEHKLTVEISGELGGLGCGGGIDVEEKKVEFKTTVGIGAGFAIGVE